MDAVNDLAQSASDATAAPARTRSLRSCCASAGIRGQSTAEGSLTWARVRQSISNFLQHVWREGALAGTTEEAFFLRCDGTALTRDNIENGRLICYIGIAP